MLRQDGEYVVNPLNAVEVTCTENKKCTDEDEGLRKFNTLADEGEYLMVTKMSTHCAAVKI